MSDISCCSIDLCFTTYGVGILSILPSSFNCSVGYAMPAVGSVKYFCLFVPTTPCQAEITKSSAKSSHFFILFLEKQIQWYYNGNVSYLKHLIFFIRCCVQYHEHTISMRSVVRHRLFRDGMNTCRSSSTHRPQVRSVSLG